MSSTSRTTRSVVSGQFKMGSHPKTILKAITLTTGGTERFFNPGIVPFLLRRRPRVALVFACIKDPSGWLAMALCRLLGTKVALLDDSWLGRDQGYRPSATLGTARRLQPLRRCLRGNEPADTGDVQALQQPAFWTSSAFSATWWRTTTTSRAGSPAGDWSGGST